jgi:drug/metabolite transporter (DMT)-like permease
MTPITQRLAWKNIALLLAVVTTQILGDIGLSRGMKLFGAVESYDLASLGRLALYLLTSPWIIGGAATLVASLLLYLSAVSRLDLSVVMPLMASSYIVNALLAWLLLRESVSPQRWLSALVIALGVGLIYRSESRSGRPAPPPPSWSLFWLFPAGLALSRLWLGVLVLALADSAGDLLTAKGAKQIGAVSLKSPLGILNWIGQILRHPLILLGVACQSLAFVCFLSLLSWADISLVRPATALGYGVSLLGARLILRERIPPGRWLGIGVIGFGVALVALETV